MLRTDYELSFIVWEGGKTGNEGIVRFLCAVCYIVVVIAVIVVSLVVTVVIIIGVFVAVTDIAVVVDVFFR